MNTFDGCKVQVQAVDDDMRKNMHDEPYKRPALSRALMRSRFLDLADRSRFARVAALEEPARVRAVGQPRRRAGRARARVLPQQRPQVLALAHHRHRRGRWTTSLSMPP